MPWCLAATGLAWWNGPRAATLEEHTGHAAGHWEPVRLLPHAKDRDHQADVRVRSHTFAFIPPAMTDKYGIPNPCTSCHADRSTAWATSSSGVLR